MMDNNSLSKTFACPSCGKSIRFNPKFIGLPIECPHCQGVVTTPHPTPNYARIRPDALPPKPTPPEVTDKSESHKKRNIIIAATLLLILFILALFFHSGSGGGARGQRGAGVNKGSGAATGTEPNATLPYDAGTGTQASGGPRNETAASDSDVPPKAILLERTSPFDGIHGGTGSIGGGGTTFFGLSATGGSFIYVVDCSGSMAGKKIKTAKESLLFSISQLDAKQDFFVFFYNTQSYAMPQGKLLAATPDNKEKCRIWVDSIKEGGGTRPQPSLLNAIAMQPEIIFFLSDGEFPIEVCDQVKAAQGDQPVTIHTIGFGSNSGEKVLKRLAAQNGGIYHFVPHKARKQ